MFWRIRRWCSVSSSCRGGEGSWSRSFRFDGRVCSGKGVIYSRKGRTRVSNEENDLMFTVTSGGR